MSDRFAELAAAWDREAARYEGYAVGSSVPDVHASIAKTLRGAAAELRSALGVESQGAGRGVSEHEAGCEWPAGHVGQHPCGRKPEPPGSPCRFCGAPVPVDGPCLRCWTPVSGNLAAVKALLALGGFSVSREAGA